MPYRNMYVSEKKKVAYLTQTQAQNIFTMETCLRVKTMQILN